MAEFFASNAIWIIIGVFFLILMVSAPCHAIFLLPFIVLPLFWYIPLEYALPINIAVLPATLILYRAIRKAMRKPVRDGFRSLVGAEAEVVSKQAAGNSISYLVRARGEGELWGARSTDILDIGDWVNIVAVKGIGVVVARGAPGSLADKTGARAQDNRKSCH